ncbi:PKD domain-containing protein [Chitinophaga sp. 22536]
MIVLNWSRTMDCLNNKATFQFYVPYAYSEVDSCAIDLNDGLGRQGYKADWRYNGWYATAGTKVIRIWIKKKNGQLDSLYTPINIVDTRVLFGFKSTELLVSRYPHWECAPKIGNTVVSQHWVFEEKQYDVECLQVTRPGMYILETTSANCDRYVRDTVYIKTNVANDYLKASFDAEMVGCGVIKFHNTSETPTGIASSQWIFPDGTTSKGLIDAQYNINWGAGDSIKLIVTSISGKKDSVIRAMRAIPVRAEDVNLGKDTVLFGGDTLRFAYSPERRPWKDSVIEANLIEWSTGAKTPYITINNAGTYWVRVTPCPQKPQEVYTDTLIVNTPSRRVQMQRGQDSMTYTFTGSTNYFVNQYHWDFGDGTIVTGNSITHTYGQNGIYKVKMYMERGGILRDSVVLPLVIGPRLKAGFTYQREGERTIRYMATSTGYPGNKLRHLWFFGDGTNGIGDTIRHTYSAPGNYRVSMNASDSVTTEMSSAFRQITIWPSLDLGKDTVFRGAPISLKINAPFYGDSSIRCVWQPGNISGHSLTVTALGTYVATVSAADGFTATDTIQVLNSPRPFIDVFDNVRDKDGKLTMIFMAGSFDPYPGTPYWHFGDASPVDTGMMVNHTYSQPGYYDVKMWRNLYPMDTTRKTVYIAPPIKVNLGPDKVMPDTLSILLNAAAALDSFYRSNIQYVSLLWSTGSTSDLLRITSPGIYTLTAKAYGIVSTDTIVIMPPAGVNPTMSYAAKDGNASKIYFENTSQIPNISTISWSFGDGSPDVSGPAVSHIFSQPGTYDVKLQVSASTGYVYTVTEKVKVWPALNLGPDTSYHGTPIRLKVNEPYFSDSAVACIWYPGAVSGKYMIVNQPGTYYVKVTAPHYAGVDTVKVSQGVLPVPRAGFSYQRANDGLYTMNFTNTSVVKTGNASASWSFGDGTSAVSWNTAHTYAAPGSYLVKLLVTDSLGIRDSVINTAYIRPRISINLGPDTVLRDGQPILLEGYDAIGGAMNDIYWLWSTGDTTHRLQINTPGTYWLRATMYGQTVADTIVVTLPHVGPTAGFEAKRANDGLYTMNFTNTSIVKTSNASASWSFGDGTSAVSWNTAHTYAAPGSYLVKLLVTDSLGIRDSAINTIYIRPRISINLGPDTVLRNGQPILLEGYDAIGGAMNDIYWLWSTGDTTHRLQINTPGTYWLRATMYGYTVSDTVVVKLPAALPPVVDSNAAVVQVKDSVPVTVTFPVARNADNVYTIQLANADNGPVPGARAGAPVVTDIVSFPSTSSRVSANVKLPDNLPCGKQYRIRVVSSSPAESSAWSQPFEVRNMPAIPLIAQRGDTLESSAAGAYQWYRNGLPVQGATSRAIRAKADGSYQVQVSAGGDCNAISAPLAMVITGLEETRLTASVLTAYPNPSSGAVYLQLEKQPAQPLLIHVYNTSGRIVHSLLMKDKQTVMDLGHMPKGLYYVQVSGREKQKPVLISIQ